MNKQEIEEKIREMGWETDLAEGADMMKLALWMQQNQSGMRWARASERLPEKEGMYCVKISGGYQTAYSRKGKDGNIRLTHSAGNIFKYEFVEWLDESASSEVERLRKENEEMLEMLKGLVPHIEWMGRKKTTPANFNVIQHIKSLIQKIEAK